MKDLLEWLYSIKLNPSAIGVQKDLLLAALIGVVSNLPKGVKSNFQQAVYIITGTLLSTILTPLVMSILGSILGSEMPPESGYGIAALIGIVGINAIKKYVINKLTSKKDDET